MGQVAAAPVIDGPEVLVATRALPVGTILDASALKFQPGPRVGRRRLLPADQDRPEGLAGHGGAQRHHRRPAVTQGALVKPGIAASWRRRWGRGCGR